MTTQDLGGRWSAPALVPSRLSGAPVVCGTSGGDGKRRERALPAPSSRPGCRAGDAEGRGSTASAPGLRCSRWLQSNGLTMTGRRNGTGRVMVSAGHTGRPSRATGLGTAATAARRHRARRR